jgi:hypothetical protein
MALIPIDNVGQMGIVKDINSWQLSPNVWTDGNPSNWIQTSYNHAFRKQFAGTGYTYDSVNDVFINPQPYSSWTLDSSYDWQPPIEKPVGRSSTWNEETQSWD